MNRSRTSLVTMKTGELKITDFCDMERFGQMMKDWADSTGLATAAVDNHGSYLCDFYNFTDFCMKFNRANPIGRVECAKSDLAGNGIYICRNGLIDFSEPITLEDGTVLGHILGGQVLLQAPDEQRYRERAKVLGVDEEAYLKALHAVNIRSREAIEASSALLSNVINMFVRSSYQAWFNAASLSEHSRIISSLSKIYFCNFYIDLTSDSFMEIDAPEDMHLFASRYTSASQLMTEGAGVFSATPYVNDIAAFNDLSTLADRLSGKQNISFEFECREEGWCRAVFIPVSSDAQGRVTHVIYALQYIQEEKEQELKIQADLKEAADRANRASQAKSEFLSRMSHDIRTPMNGIIGMTRIALEQPNGEKTNDCLKKIDTSSAYLLGLINDVLDMSRIESGEITLLKEPYPVEEFRQYIDSVLRPQAEAKHQTFIVNAEVSRDYVPVMDKLRTNQIVFNLLSNAIKYTQPGGRVEYCVAEEMREDQMYMKVEVKDNGRGMSEEFQKVLFEPYTQEDRVRSMNISERGSGLGLAIVYKLVTLMKGTISVCSRLNEGSTFTVILPLECIPMEQYQRQRKNSAAENTDALKGRRILVCEDNDLNQEIAASILRHYGIEPDIAENGEAGKNMFLASKPGTYYAVLMDLRMPLMDGYEAAAAIRALPHEDALKIPIIAMTADVFEEDIKHCLNVGMNDHIAKPLEPNDLYETLIRYINI